METIAPIATLAGSLLLLATLAFHLRASRAVARRRRADHPVRRHPSITVVRPVRGRDPGAEENFRAALETGYPGDVETIFVFDDRADPGLPVARAVMERHRASGRPGTVRIALAGPPPAGRTGKLNAMIAGLKAARGELVAFGDSDTRPDGIVLRVLVETLLGSPGAGCAFAQVVVPGTPRTSGDAMQSLLVNAMYGPGVAVASEPAGDLPFMMGQLVVFTRPALAAIGGPAAADGHLVDDMAIGKALFAAGYRNVVSPHPLAIATDGLSFGAFLKMMRRWLIFQRDGLPASFTRPLWMQGALFWATVVLFGASVAAGLPVTAGIAAVTALVHGAGLAALNRQFGGAPLPPRLWWTVYGLYLLGPLAQAAAIVHPMVDWRGRTYELDSNARLAAADPRPVRRLALARRRVR